MHTTGRPGVSIELDVDWGDMDANGHVNNVVYFRYFENARIAFLRESGWFDAAAQQGPGFVLKSVSAVFRAPLCFPDRVRVTAVPTHVGIDRVTLEHQVTSMTTAAILAEGVGVVVAFDYARKVKVPFPSELAGRLRLRAPRHCGC